MNNYSLKYFFLILIVLWAGTGRLTGQTSLSDTTFRLQQVTVTGTPRQQDNNAGARVSSIHSTIIQSAQTRNLGEVLSENSLIYIKSIGQGGLSTSSFRGTSSNHTQVNWNGIFINPIMGGTFNFAQFPMFFTDEVTLFHGNSYLKNGTGALGGSIHLNNHPDWNPAQLPVNLLVEYGSNQTYTGGIGWRWVKKNFLSRTRVYYQQSDNDFRYLNKVLQKDPFYQRRKDAEYRQGGVMQELYYKLGAGQQLSANIWYQSNQNNLPQPVMVNVKSHEEQKDKNWRSYLAYSGTSGKHVYQTSLAYLHEQMDYSKEYQGGYAGTHSQNLAGSWIVKGEYTYRLDKNIEIGGSLNYRRDQIQSTAYANLIRRHTVALQVNTLWHPSSRTSMNLQLMTERNEKKFMPTFSAGIAGELIKNRLDLKGTIAYNYHYPTLNDLYWQPGGNPELVPEKGMAYDMTLSYRPLIRDGAIRLRADLTYYLMHIRDWIVWLPTEQGYIWSPQNLNKVLSHGAELRMELTFDTGACKHRFSFNYGYSPSLNRDKKGEYDASYNKQLPYIPRHKWNTRYNIRLNNWSATYSVSYTDVRFTSTDNAYHTNAYMIHDADLSYSFSFKKSRRLVAKIRIGNLFNTYYESTQYYPMPLRSVFSSLAYFF